MGKSNKRTGDQTIVVPFHQVSSYTTSANSFVQEIDAVTFSPRAGYLSDVYSLYRYVSFRFRINCISTSSSALAVGVSITDQDVGDTATSTVAQVMDVPYSVYLRSSSTTVPSEWVSIPRSALLRQQTKWWKTQTTDTDTFTDELLNQMTLFAYAPTSAATSFDFEVKAVIEFSAPAQSALNPRPGRFPKLPGVSLPQPAPKEKHVEGCRCSDCLAAAFS